MVIIVDNTLSCWNFSLPYDYRLLFILKSNYYILKSWLPPPFFFLTYFGVKVSIKNRSLVISSPQLGATTWAAMTATNCWGNCNSQIMSIKSAFFCHWHSCIVIMCLITLCKRIPTEILLVARVWSFLFNQNVCYIALLVATRLHWHCDLLCSTPDSLYYIDTIDYFVVLCDFGVQVQVQTYPLEPNILSLLVILFKHQISPRFKNVRLAF